MGSKHQTRRRINPCKIEQLARSDIRLFFWTIGMTAEYMGVSKQRVRVLMNLGRLKPYALDERTVVFLRADVESFRKRPGGRPRLTEDQKRDVRDWLEWGTLYPWMRTAHPSLIRGECALCGAMVGTVLAGEGTTARVTVRHKPKAFKRKEVGAYTIIRQCAGSGKVPKGWRGPQVEYVSPSLAG